MANKVSITYMVSDPCESFIICILLKMASRYSHCDTILPTVSPITNSRCTAKDPHLTSKSLKPKTRRRFERSFSSHLEATRVVLSR